MRERSREGSETVVLSALGALPLPAILLLDEFHDGHLAKPVHHPVVVFGELGGLLVKPIVGGA